MTDHSATDKRVSWAELFFDLVFVVAVTRVSELIGSNHGWGGLLHALVVFIPIYWLWVGTAIQTNLQDTSRPLMQIRVLAIALAAVFMALALPDAYDHLGMVFAFAYWLGRIVIGAQLLYASARTRTMPINPFAVSMFLTGPMLIVGALLHGDARLAIWGAAALIDLSTPTLLRTRLRGMHYDAGHLSERFATFVLIALGESVVAVVTSTGHGDLDLLHGCAVAASFAVSAGMFWVYFYFAADAMRHALATAKVQLDVTRLVLSYGHLSFIAAIILVSVGLHESIAHPSDALTWEYTGLLLGGAALYLASFGFTRWAMFRLVSWTRLTTAAVVLAFALVVPHIPALATLVVLALILAALNIVEYTRVGHIGWRAKLLRRAEHDTGLAAAHER
jgi:low temperature requirement protein LtrA